ncbi:MAG TPA: MupA/Atu3671 family FMN-dependent luciferase-like monooxygenase [Terriglobales bacterium]|nr:MupA/Atu3671 family FMN-dependent luciferase-like monooxygenase [Terriglobales bacterium]
MQFSIFFFGAGDVPMPRSRYSLLLDAAKFADKNGFSAVWTPERHFHEFGANFPNPSILTAALAVITERVQLRAGSLVVPLHHPVRVAEEWSVCDNLSNGRVAISAAPGWNASDFVLNPDCYEDRRELMYRDLDIIRRLWEGEAVEMPGPRGEGVRVRMYPRPVQPKLPIWVTSAGTSDTWAKAGEIGANVLTHLVRQGVNGLTEKIRLYRESFAANHAPRTGTVSLMLHTFVGADLATVREKVRAPMIEYLKTASDIFASGRAGGKPTVERSVEEVQALLGQAFDRYFESGALLGTPESCLPLLRQIAEIGVDEVACLIDFGLDEASILEALPHLARLQALAQSDSKVVAARYACASEATAKSA